MKTKPILSSSLLAEKRKSPPLQFKKNGEKYTYVDDEIRYFDKNSVSPNTYERLEPSYSPCDIQIGRRYELPQHPVGCDEFYEVEHDPAKQLPAIKLNRSDRFVEQEKYKLIKRGNEYVIQRFE